VHRTHFVAAAWGTRKTYLCLALCLILAALWVGVGSAKAGTYWNGGLPASTTVSDVYDGCSFRYYYDELDKATSDYGRVFFIDSVGSWHDEVSGYGDVWTSEPNYNYQKKAAARNSTSVGYNATAWDDYYTFICT
jgi:hypothetical protein